MAKTGVVNMRGWVFLIPFNTICYYRQWE